MLLVINSTDGENVIISIIGEGNLMELVGDLRDCAF